MEALRQRFVAKRRAVLVILAFAVLFFSACKKDAAISIDAGYNYVPLETGSYIVYDVDSIYFNNFTKKSDTFKFQLKEEIGLPFTDLLGNTSYEYKRYKRFYTNNVDINTLAFVLTDVWYVTKLIGRYERVEESFRYSRLKFPVTQGATWNGNAFNSEDEWNYTIQEVDVKYLSFDSTATVLQRDVETKISKQLYTEKYARNVGLVYKKVIDVESQDISPNVNIMNKIQKGVIYEWRYVSHGKN
ncbi:MAG: hypothetical protein ACO3EE_02070 [Flavobacteriales bacterium]